MKGFAGVEVGVVEPPFRAARAGLKPGATGFCCVQADRAKTSPITSKRRISVWLGIAYLRHTPSAVPTFLGKQFSATQKVFAQDVGAIDRRNKLERH